MNLLPSPVPRNIALMLGVEKDLMQPVETLGQD
jgi:hypothetical protein